MQLDSATNNLLEARQLGSLGSLTGIFEGILNPSAGSQTAAAAPAPVSAPGPAAAIPSPAVGQDCSDAIQKIDDALETSERYMKASGNQPTIKDIQAVLVILSDSLAADCDDKGVFSRGVSNIADAAALKSRAVKKCSDCERQLYGIVKGLQKILSMTQEGVDESSVSSAVGNALSATSTPMLAATTGTFVPDLISTSSILTLTTTITDLPTSLSLA